MNNDTKVALAAETGILVGKYAGVLGAWWIFGGLAALFLLKSPETQRALGSGAKSLYSRVRK